MSTTFSVPQNNALGAVATLHANGASTLQLVDAGPFPTVGPYKVTAYTGSGESITVRSILTISGRTGNVLAITGAAEGTSNVALAAGVKVAMFATAGSFSEIHDAIHALEAGLPAKADDSTVVHNSGNETIGGVKTFSSTIQGNISGNAATATTATTAGALSGSIAESQVTGLVGDLASKATDTAVVHLAGTETVTGTKTFSTAIHADITGNAATATTAAGLSAPIAESQVTGLVGDLAAKAPLASPTFTGTVTVGSLSGLLKAATGAISTATAGTDYLAPAGNGSALTGLTGSQIAGDIAGNAANVTGTVAIAHGGTGQTSASAAINALVPAQTGNSGKVLGTDGTSVSWVTASGGGSPGGSDGQVQFNSGGAFAGDSNLTYDLSTHTLNLSGVLATASSSIYQARFGTNWPFYIMANNPTLGLNTFYSGGWKFASTGYAAAVDFGANGDGSYTVYSTTATGTSGSGVDLVPRFQVRPNGAVCIGANASDFGSGVSVQPNASTTKGLVVRGATSQSADLVQWQDPTGTPLSGVDAAGYVRMVTGSGAPTSTPADGAIYLDVTNSKIYCRVGGAWKSATLA